jgi:Flp pilus assembly protein TadD
MLILRRKHREISLTSEGDRAFEAGQWKLAADSYRRVLDRNPANLSIWLKYGDACKEMGDFGRAEGAYRAAQARDISSPEPPLHLGHILRMQGRQQEAEAAYLQVVGLHSSNTEALTGLESLGWSERQLTALRHVAEPAGGTPRE